ncbi:Glycopeptide antibiotics resistance protein [Fictibacillus solisalsi]|uniref:Glycopeptide antibiotics resistance protein n=1 Tax=Fictibacillus solisalsi TaxID=459525 RepID=A0A1H0ADE5_9BACL|nr:VanZ family protein [Fictibacillus solisalsi]SDN31579.1 Glycopeptide antibiotics resistance protein [Fictibacillus solisalsi]
MTKNKNVTKKKARLKWRNIGWLMFLIYFTVLIYVTLFTYNHYVYGKSLNLVLFDSIRLMWKSGDYWLIFKNIIGNVVLFFPLGFLPPLIHRFFSKWGLMFFIGFGTSSIIEVLQYCYAHRIFDIDDILLNGFGTMVGLGVFKFCALIYRIIENNILKRKR